MRSAKTLTAIILISFVFLIGCNDYVRIEESNFYSDDEYEIISQDLDLPQNPDAYNVFVTGFGTTNDNMLATLGRVLFYDKDLSSDGTISCASCHDQQLAFADGVSFSEGVHGNLTSRNSIALGSLTSFDDEYGGEGGAVPGLFWDERAPSVKAQMQQTFANPDEMGMDLSSLRGIVGAKPYYQTLFEIANFEGGSANNKITTDNILTAIETFVRSLSTTGSKFDQVAFDKGAFFAEGGLEGDWSEFSASENRGKHLFDQSCGSCHSRSIVPFGFTDPSEFEFEFGKPKSTANNGLDMTYIDKGVGSFTQREIDNGKFKIPALKNIALSAPYMHDGRFESLSEVIDFYNEGIQDHKNLDTALKDEAGKAKRLDFDEQDKNDLIAFLNTLTDHNMATDSKWSDPFKK